MITLAIDSATDRLSVAVRAPGGETFERHLEGARRHAAGLVPLVNMLLREAGEATPAALTRLVVADGPGSFTGLRVSAAFAKGLARAGTTALFRAPSLLGRAWRGISPRAGVVLAAASALRGEVYAGWYRCDPTAGVVELVPAMAMDFEALGRGPRPDLVVGDGPDGMLEAAARRWEVPRVPREDTVADARALLELLGVPGGAAVVENPEAWEPVYGRPAEAQARWEREHGRPLPDSTGHPG